MPCLVNAAIPKQPPAMLYQTACYALSTQISLVTSNTYTTAYYALPTGVSLVTPRLGSKHILIN